MQEFRKRPRLEVGHRNTDHHNDDHLVGESQDMMSTKSSRFQPPQSTLPTFSNDDAAKSESNTSILLPRASSAPNAQTILLHNAAAAVVVNSNNNNNNNNPTIQLLQTEISSLRSELSHSQSIRALERTNFTRNESRLKRQLCDALEEIQQDQDLINELRSQVDKYAKQMEESRNMFLERIQWHEEQWEEMDKRDKKRNKKKKKGGEGRKFDEENFSDDCDNEEENGEDEDNDMLEQQTRCRNCHLLQQRCDATEEQIKDLETTLLETERRCVSAEVRAKNSELKLSSIQCSRTNSSTDVDILSSGVQIGGGGDSGSSSSSSRHQDIQLEDERSRRDTRIKLAESERENRDLRRQVNSMKERVTDMVQLRERAASSQRRVVQLEKEVLELTRQVEEGKETHCRWMEFRNVIVDETFMLLDNKDDVGFINDINHTAERDYSCANAVVPPEIATVIAKFNYLKRKVQAKEDEIATITRTSEKNQHRCQVLEKELDETVKSLSTFKKTVEDQKKRIDASELENRKIVAQQHIWKREVEGMRSLLETYELQEDKNVQSNKNLFGQVTITGKDKNSNNAEGLQISLNAAREEILLLSKTNDNLETTIAKLKEEHESSKSEHEKVLVKYNQLRNAVLEERTKAEKAEVRACQAETLAGKGSFNSDVTRVVHLKCNPLMDAIKDKYEREIEVLKRKLGDIEDVTKATTKISSSSVVSSSASKSLSDSKSSVSTMTPVPAKDDRGSLDSSGSSHGGGSSDSVDVQKLHSRLKEQFRNQIALFRQGVYLITGFKIDMTPDSENDCQIFTVRSVYGEREEDHLLFKWSPKKKTKLDMLNTDMAQLLMKGSSGVYVKEHGSWPGFMASVTLHLFDQQTIL